MEPFTSLLALLLLLLLPALLFVFSKPSNANDPLKSYPLIGHLPQFMKNQHRFLDWLTELVAASPTNTVTIRRPVNVLVVNTANPANVEHLLLSNFENYPKGTHFVSTLEDFLGRGIFNADGQLWRVQRKTASLEFNTKSLRSFVVDIVQREVGARLLPLLRGAACNGAVIDLQDVFELFAFDNVCRVAFNEDPACLAVADEEGKVEESRRGEKPAAEFARTFADATSISAARFRYAVPWLWGIKRLVNVGSERRLRESISAVHDFATRIIRSRKKEKECSPTPLVLQHQDLLSRFVDGDDNSDEYLRDIVISFVLAGRETTSSALTWFFWLLSSQPEVERRILDELRPVRAARVADFAAEGGNEENFSFGELRGMHYLHAAISEAMRLYPPVPINRTASLADDLLPDGTFVGKGWFLSYNAYAMGRMERIWGQDCMEYKPERWLDEGGHFRQESPFKYPVFHAGPRTCLGKEMAYIQMKSIAASVLERFVVELEEPGRCPEKTLSLTLRMKGGLPVRVRERGRVST